MPTFLFEIGLEEIPARMIAAAQEELEGRVEKLLLAKNWWTMGLRCAGIRRRGAWRSSRTECSRDRATRTRSWSAHQ